MDDNIWGSIINLIIILLKRRIRHWEYFGGQFKEVGNHYRVMSPYILKLNTLIYAVRFAFIGPSQVTTILIGHYYFTSILGKRNAIKNFYLYHVLLATKVKDWPLRSVREGSELHCMQRNLFTCIWLFIWQLQAKWTKTFSFVPNGNWIIFSPVLCYLVRDLLLCHLCIFKPYQKM